MNYTRIECLCANNDTKTTYTVNLFKDGICPKCQVATTNNIKQCFYTLGNPYTYVYVIRICGHCGEAVFDKYTIYNMNELSDYFIDLSKHTCVEYPIKTNLSDFNKIIKDLSPNFIEIYGQAEIAENEGCDKICGMGYRKSLEFLVKDYLIDKHPNLKETISKELLSASINRIEDIEIKQLAQKCAWLGNDECHYSRKHENHGIKDLKIFISALVKFIECKVVLKEANTLQGHK